MPFFTQLFFQYPATESMHLIIKLHNEILVFLTVMWILFKYVNCYLYKTKCISLFTFFDTNFFYFFSSAKSYEQQNTNYLFACDLWVLALLNKKAIIESGQTLGVIPDKIHHCIVNVHKKSIDGYATTKGYHPRDSIVTQKTKPSDTKIEKSSLNRFDKKILKPQKVDDAFVKTIAKLRETNPEYADLSDKTMENIIKGYYVKNHCLSKDKRHDGTTGSQFIRKTRVRLQIKDSNAVIIDEKKRGYWEENQDNIKSIMKELEKEDKPSLNLGIKEEEIKK